jgi:predicted transposase YbfD/YdcC
VAKLSQGEEVSIDGKTIRGSRQAGNKAIVHMVSAWANTNHLVLAQRRVAGKSNEITAIPKLLQVLELSGTVVTIDAIGCQRSIAQQIIARKAGYIMAVKENQKHLLEDVQNSFRMLAADAVAEETDCGHGRIERRTCSVLGDCTLIEHASQWTLLRSVVRIQAERFHETNGEIEAETRYYISSLPPQTARLNRAIRRHWGIENSLHWVLDLAFHEDQSRKRAGHAAQNFSPLNRIALNLLKNDKSVKVGVRGKRLFAGWDNDFFLRLLRNVRSAGPALRGENTPESRVSVLIFLSPYKVSGSFSCLRGSIRKRFRNQSSSGSRRIAIRREARQVPVLPKGPK